MPTACLVVAAVFQGGGPPKLKADLVGLEEKLAFPQT
jgi:hypothetical protein